MAKAPAASSAAAEVGTAVAVAEPTKGGLAVMSDFEDFAGLGMEQVQTEDLAIPFIRILAQLSPQVNKRDGAYIPGAEPGMLLNTVTGEIFDGEKGLEVIPCFYSRQYVEWKPRTSGGGYVASYEVDNPIVNKTTRNERGEDILPNGNLLVNTARFFVIVVTESGPQRALVTMSSTQLKKARKWLSVMNGLMARNSKGEMYILPMMSQRYLLKTVAEQNDKGTWFGFDAHRVGQLDLKNEADNELFHMGMSFAKAIRAGEVRVKETSLDDAGHSGSGRGGNDSGDREDNIPF